MQISASEPRKFLRVNRRNFRETSAETSAKTSASWSRFLDIARICTWCNTSMGATIIEDESHMLYECDLYEDIRAKLITRLNRSPPVQNTHPNNPELTLFIDQQALRTNLMNILSPYTTSNINYNPADSYNIHHKPLSIKPTALIEQKLNYRRSYIVLSSVTHSKNDENLYTNCNINPKFKIQ